MTRLNDIHNRQLDRKDMARGVVRPNSSVADIDYLLNLLDEQQAKLDKLTNASQQALSLLEAIREDFSTSVAPGYRELYLDIEVCLRDTLYG